MEVKDLHWASGFMEGEGCFSHNRPGEPVVTACQASDPETLLRLHKLFGGTVYKRKPQHFGKLTRQEIYEWRCHGVHAVGAMMTLYSLMSLRRKARIRELLAAWKLKPKGHGSRPYVGKPSVDRIT